MNDTSQETNKKKGISFLFAVLLIIAAVALDQFTKYLAVTELKGNASLVLLDGIFELHYLENNGAAFGIFQNQRLIFIAGAAVLSAAVLYLYRRIPYERKYIPLRICCILVTAGAVGNMIDRIHTGYVVDFFYFCLIDFPVFNVADCYVVVSCVLFAVLVLFYYKEEHDFDFLKNEK